MTVGDLQPLGMEGHREPRWEEGVVGRTNAYKASLPQTATRSCCVLALRPRRSLPLYPPTDGETEPRALRPNSGY